MSSAWQEVDLKARLTLLTELAATQHGLVSTEQAESVGLHRSLLTRLVREGRLDRLQRGVYCVCGVPASWKRTLLEVCLAAGPGAVVSNFTAAELHGLDEVPKRKSLHLLVEAQGRRTSKGAVVHRTGALEPSECTVVDAVPVTTPQRTLLDLAKELREDVLESVLMDACRRSLIDPDRFAEALAAIPGRGHRGIQKLRRVVAAGTFKVFHRSKLEARGYRLLVKRYEGLESNYVVVESGERVGEVDLALPALKIAIECDSEKFHCTRQQKADDRAKTRRLRAAGWIVLRIWWRHTVGSPAHLFKRVDRAVRVSKVRRAARMRSATPPPKRPLPSSYFYAPPPPGWG